MTMSTDRVSCEMSKTDVMSIDKAVFVALHKTVRTCTLYSFYSLLFDVQIQIYEGVHVNASAWFFYVDTPRAYLYIPPTNLCFVSL